MVLVDHFKTSFLMVSSRSSDPGPPVHGGGGAAEADDAPISRVATTACIGVHLMFDEFRFEGAQPRVKALGPLELIEL